MRIPNHPSPLKCSTPQSLIMIFFFSLQTDLESYVDNINLVKSEFEMPDQIFNFNEISCFSVCKLKDAIKLSFCSFQMINCLEAGNGHREKWSRFRT